MALSFTNVIDKGRRVYQIGGGLKLAVIDMTSSDVSVDYSSGFDLATNASKMGFRKVLAVLDATIRASAGTERGVQYQWSGTTGKLRFKETVVNTIDDADADVDIIDADVVRMVVIGV